MRRTVRTLAFLFLSAAPACAAERTASVYYFDHDYRITSGLSEAVEDVIKSTSSLKLLSVFTELTYTKGDLFVLDGPEDLNSQELNSTTSYAPLEDTEVLSGASSLVIVPKRLMEDFAPALQESVSPHSEVERRPAQLLEGLSPSGIRFRVLRAPWRTQKRLWEPTLKARHLVNSAEGPAELTVLSIPMGLNGLNRRMTEDAADKRTAVMLSLGAGGTLAGAVMKAGPGRTFDYMRAAGTDIAALEPEDLKNFLAWSKAGGLQVSSGTPEFICTNVSVSDPELAKLVKPYAVREVAGARVGFISLIPSRAAADLAGSPFEVSDPKDEKALYRVIEELRREKRVRAVIAVSFLKNDEIGWLLNLRGIDALIGPKTWDSDSGRKARVELDRWDREIHAGPALTIFPDSSGTGVIRMEFSPRGALSAMEAAPPPDDPREPVFYAEQVYMKEKIARYFMGTGDSLLPDLRGRAGADYSIPAFFNMSAALLRREFSAEVSVLRIKPFSSRVMGDIPTAMAKTWLGPDEPVELALVPGFHLASLLRKTAPEGMDDPDSYAGADYYAVSGLDASGRLAGLPISPSEKYVVALPASLVSGKPFIKILPKKAGQPATLHAAVIGALAELKARSASRQAWESAVIEASRNITPPRALWRLNLRSLSMQMSNTGVTGPAGYASINESRLSAVNQTQMQGSGRLYSEYYSGRFRLDAGIAADYGKTVLRPKGQPHLTTESVDQLTYEAELIYRMKNYDGKLGKLVVGPYASAAYDTEFSNQDPLPLRKVVRGSGGFKIFEGAALQELYVGLTTEQVYTYLPARTKHALESGFRLSMPLPGTALQLNADGNYRNFARSRFDTVYDLKQRLELNLKVSTRLYGEVMISPYVNYYLAQGKKLPGSASNLTAGFALEYSRLFKLKR